MGRECGKVGVASKVEGGGSGQFGEDGEIVREGSGKLGEDCNVMGENNGEMGVDGKVVGGKEDGFLLDAMIDITRVLKKAKGDGKEISKNALTTYANKSDELARI